MAHFDQAFVIKQLLTLQGKKAVVIERAQKVIFNPINLPFSPLITMSGATESLVNDKIAVWITAEKGKYHLHAVNNQGYERDGIKYNVFEPAEFMASQGYDTPKKAWESCLPLSDDEQIPVCEVVESTVECGRKVDLQTIIN